MTAPLEAVKAAKTAKAAVAARGNSRGGGRRQFDPNNRRTLNGPERHQPRNLNGLTEEEKAEELEARKADAKWASDERKAGRDPNRGYKPAEEESASPSPASPGGGLPSVPMPAVASTGSGFLLGVFAWALGLAYLRGGSPEVKKFLAAKFLNKTTGG